MEARTALFLVLFGLVSLSSAEVFKVGNNAGWTIVGNVNYNDWASNKKFHVGDVIHFEYNKEYHNVMVVSKAHYKECNVSSPLKVLKTGNDSITVTRTGHHFFICGVPGHCALGQRVDIRVVNKDEDSNSDATGTGTVASPPKPSGCARFVGGLGFAFLAVLVNLILV